MPPACAGRNRDDCATAERGASEDDDRRNGCAGDVAHASGLRGRIETIALQQSAAQARTMTRNGAVGTVPSERCRRNGGYGRGRLWSTFVVSGVWSAADVRPR